MLRYQYTVTSIESVSVWKDKQIVRLPMYITHFGHDISFSGASFQLQVTVAFQKLSDYFLGPFEEDNIT